MLAHVVERPTGTVSFLFTDIEGSAALAQAHPSALPALLARHHAILNQAVTAHGGHVFQIVGDGFAVAFATATAALDAAMDAQRALQREAWAPASIKVRMGIHAGPAEASADGDESGGYDGYATLALTQRVMSAAHAQQILLSATAAELVRNRLPKSTTLWDLGANRLKGWTDPEHLWQVVAPDLRNDFPPLQTLDAVPNNLPIQVTSFIGREDEISEVRRLLPTTRLLTLIGAGGSGKTRLSLQVATEVLDAYPDGAWLIELAPVADPALVPNIVAAALGVREEEDRPLLATLMTYLHAKQALIVLDNCEHLLEACATFSGTVLQGSPRTRVLATSREALGIGGELAWQVPTLPTPNPEATLSIEELGAYASVRLFIERASFARNTFRVTSANAQAIAQICRRLDGIPLAIELAAARVKALDVHQIAERLDDRFHLLTGGSRAALPRQQTLHALIDWSHELLPGPERVLFRRLAVFAAGWTLEAAEAVCAGDGIDGADVLELLTRLVEKSLVVLDVQGIEPRYRMLETIRQYALGKRDEAREGERLRDRHLAQLCGVAEVTEPRFFHPDQLAWYLRIDAELENVRAALDWSLAGIGVESGLRLTMALHRYWYARQYCREAFDWLQRLLAAQGAVESRSRARALFVSSHLLTFFGDRTVARGLAETSLQLSQALDDREGIVNASWMLGNLYELDERARPYFEASLSLAHEIGYTFGAMHCLTYYGRFEMLLGRYGAAITLLHECEGEARKLGGDLDQLADCRAYLGEIAMLQGDNGAAGALLDESMALYQAAGSIFGVCTILSAKGRLALLQGQPERAIEYFRESLARRRRFTSPRPVAVILAYLAVSHAATDQPITAVRLAGARMALDDGSLPVVAELNDVVGALRARLDESTFATAWIEGKAMTMDGAIAYVVDQFPRDG